MHGKQSEQQKRLSLGNVVFMIFAICLTFLLLGMTFWLILAAVDSEGKFSTVTMIFVFTPICIVSIILALVGLHSGALSHPDKVIRNSSTVLLFLAIATVITMLIQ